MLALMLRRAHAEALYQAECTVRAYRRIRTNLGSTGVSPAERPRRMPLWEAADAA
jgi:hypothetical protein